MTTQEKSKLLSEFEYLEGISSNEFDSKDWIRFDRFVERRAEENKTEEKLYTKEQMREAFNAGLAGATFEQFINNLTKQ